VQKNSEEHRSSAQGIQGVNSSIGLARWIRHGFSTTCDQLLSYDLKSGDLDQAPAVPGYVDDIGRQEAR
jgi:hypothetical protein